MTIAKHRRRQPKVRKTLHVYEVYDGDNENFHGAIVVEQAATTERILFWFQSIGATGPYENDSEREDITDYRCYGLPDSEERMPDEPYGWTLWKPGQYHKGDEYRGIFPFCPFRYEEMLAQRCLLSIIHQYPVPVSETESTGIVTPYPWVGDFQKWAKRQKNAKH